ncbi:MAG: carboxypeptidase regulatory-like domain-containing protein [Candidatus Eremiobacteraeota bacterium]|nr:carboxypeptidase regulatory-like domain-containing protein [Candidatus Eremiobacteraeota bacterium]
MKNAACAMLAAALLAGHVVDRTTGQGLANVRVTAGGASTVTDRAGAYALHGVKAGALTITLESDDVPRQTFPVTIRGSKTHLDVRACSTTLDYECAHTFPNDAGAS